MGIAEDRLSPCGRLVRQHDPDRYLVALFSPAEAREAQFAIAAFNFEIARVRETVSEPLLGEMRLQWWRDAIAEIYDGRVRRHEVAEPLAEAIREFGLGRVHFDRLIDARSRDLDEAPFADFAALETYAEATAAPVLVLGLEALGAANDAALRAARHIGTAWALVGVVRAVAFHAGQNRLLLPMDLLAAAGVDPARAWAEDNAPAMQAVTRQISDKAHDHLAAARALRRAAGKPATRALLAAGIIDSHIRRLEAAKHNVFDARVQQAAPLRQIRLTWLALRGRF